MRSQTGTKVEEVHKETVLEQCGNPASASLFSAASTPCLDRGMTCVLRFKIRWHNPMLSILKRRAGYKSLPIMSANHMTKWILPIKLEFKDIHWLETPKAVPECLQSQTQLPIVFCFWVAEPQYQFLVLHKIVAYHVWVPLCGGAYHTGNTRSSHLAH